MRGLNLPRKTRGAGALRVCSAIRRKTGLLQRYPERVGGQRRRARLLRKNGHARAGNPNGKDFVTAKSDY